MLRSIVVFLLLALASPAYSCLQFSDSRAIEASWSDKDVSVLTGHFLRNPPLYHEMRLSRVARDLEGLDPPLDLYDEAAVSCELLGRTDDAIDWMARKRKVLDRMGSAPTEQWFRYKANLGTFLAHRWIATGADRSRMEDLWAARDLIAGAIELNPDAHFGRERYQLIAIEWLISPPDPENVRGLPDFLGVLRTESDGPRFDQIAVRQHPDAERALLGLIVLGAGWNSVDVYNALAHYYAAKGMGWEAAIARHRIAELIDDGKGSLLPGAPNGRALKRSVALPISAYELKENVPQRYAEMRYESDAWLRHRWDFMIPLLQRGMHPDTHPDFWAGYHEPTAEEVAMPAALRVWKFNRPLLFGGILLGVLMASGAVGRFRRGSAQPLIMRRSTSSTTARTAGSTGGGADWRGGR